MKKSKLVLFGIVFASFAVLYASPFYAIQQMRQAAQQQDAQRLNTYVDYPAVRQSLKTSINLKMRQAQDKPATDNPYVGFAVGLFAKFADVMVDTLVTPQGLAALMDGKRPDRTSDSPESQPAKSEKKVNLAYRYQGLNDFRLTVADEAGKPTMSLNFQRHGLLNWKLNAIELE